MCIYMPLKLNLKLGVKNKLGFFFFQEVVCCYIVISLIFSSKQCSLLIVCHCSGNNNRGYISNTLWLPFPCSYKKTLKQHHCMHIVNTVSCLVNIGEIGWLSQYSNGLGIFTLWLWMSGDTYYLYSSSQLVLFVRDAIHKISQTSEVDFSYGAII